MCLSSFSSSCLRVKSSRTFSSLPRRLTIWEVLTPAPGAKAAAVMMPAEPGVAAARLPLPVETLETPGVAVVTPERLGVVEVRLLLLLLVAGRLAVPPLVVVVAGKEVGLPFCHLDHCGMALCLHDALEFHGREFFVTGTLPVFWFRSFQIQREVVEAMDG